MIKLIKNLAKKSKATLRAYKIFKFIREIPFKDYLNFKKLVLIEKVYPYTMVGYSRLANVYFLAELIEKSKVKGAFVECGVWKGGCAAIMGFVVERAKSNRKVWLFDSFQGMPEPSKKDGVDKDGVPAKEYTSNRDSGRLVPTNLCSCSLDDVEKIFFSILKIDRKNVVVRKGWFQETLPEAKKEIGPIAILRLDSDWYESTKCCLENLYDNVIPGGYIIIDDYGFWEGCKKAVDEFLRERDLEVNLISINEMGIYFQKP